MHRRTRVIVRARGSWYPQRERAAEMSRTAWHRVLTLLPGPPFPDRTMMVPLRAER